MNYELNTHEIAIQVLTSPSWERRPVASLPVTAPVWPRTASLGPTVHSVSLLREPGPWFHNRFLAFLYWCISKYSSWDTAVWFCVLALTSRFIYVLCLCDCCFHLTVCLWPNCRDSLHLIRQLLNTCHQIQSMFKCPVVSQFINCS